jgi:uncharacterized protein (DUF486 family)
MKWLPILMLFCSNIFMTFAWYGHLKSLKSSPLWIVILISWGIAFFEYCFQVPANRMGSEYFNLQQLKIIQEIITMIVFSLFSIFYMKDIPNKNLMWAFLCLIGAVYFIFKPE